MKGEPGPESLWARGTTSESRSSRLSCPPASPCCLAIGFAHLDPLDLHGGIWVNRKGAAPGGGWRRWMVIHVLPFMQECTQLGWPISQLLRIRLFPTTVAPSSCTAAVVEQGDGCARSVIAAAFFPSSMHTHKGHGCDSRRKPLPTHCHRHSIPLGLWLSLSLSLSLSHIYIYTHTHTHSQKRSIRRCGGEHHHFERAHKARVALCSWSRVGGAIIRDGKTCARDHHFLLTSRRWEWRARNPPPQYSSPSFSPATGTACLLLSTPTE